MAGAAADIQHGRAGMRRQKLVEQMIHDATDPCAAPRLVPGVILLRLHVGLPVPMPESKSAVQPVLLVQDLGGVPHQVRLSHLHLRRRFGVEIALADTGSPSASLDETHTLAAKLAPRTL